MTTRSKRYRISLRPLLRYLGVFVPMVIGLPHFVALIGLLYFTIFPSKTGVNGQKTISWEGILMSVVFARRFLNNNRWSADSWG